MSILTIVLLILFFPLLMILGYLLVAFIGFGWVFLVGYIHKLFSKEDSNNTNKPSLH